MDRDKGQAGQQHCRPIWGSVLEEPYRGKVYSVAGDGGIRYYIYMQGSRGKRTFYNTKEEAYAAFVNGRQQQGYKENLGTSISRKRKSQQQEYTQHKKIGCICQQQFVQHHRQQAGCCTVNSRDAACCQCNHHCCSQPPQQQPSTELQHCPHCHEAFSRTVEIQSEYGNAMVDRAAAVLSSQLQESHLGEPQRALSDTMQPTKLPHHTTSSPEAAEASTIHMAQLPGVPEEGTARQPSLQQTAGAAPDARAATPSAQAAAPVSAPIPAATDLSQCAAGQVGAACLDSGFGLELCVTLSAAEEVMLHCLSKVGEGKWQKTGEQFSVTIMHPLGSGGTAEVYCCQVSVGGQTTGVAATTTCSQSTALAGTADQAAAAITVQGSCSNAAAGYTMSTAALPTSSAVNVVQQALSASGSTQFALKIPRDYTLLPEAAQRSMPAGEYYRNAYSLVQQEHEIMASLSRCKYIMKSFAYVRVVYVGGQVLPGLLMQLADQGTVLRLLKPVGVSFTGLDAETAWRIMYSTAEAVASLHRQKWIYEDVKPSNVLVIAHPNGGKSFKLVDFSSCRPMDSDNMTPAGAVGHTDAFAAPEVMRQERHGKQSDSWSLGCLLLALRTGCTPWWHLAKLPHEEAVAKRCYEEAMSCQMYAVVLDDHEKAFLRHTLHRDCNQRPTVQQLLNDKYLRSGPVAVAKESAKLFAKMMQKRAAQLMDA